MRAAERRSGSRTPITRREVLVLVLVSLQLIFGSWAVGVQSIPMQWVFLGLSVVGFGALFLPLRNEALYGQFRVVSLTPCESFGRLVRFPLFWLGLAMIAYVVVQNVNAAYSFQRTEEGRWFMQRESYVGWLPAGVQAPFEIMSGWRQLLMYLPVWLLGCTLWVGLRTRRAIRVLLLVLLGNGLVWAAVAMGQHFANTPKLLGFLETSKIMGHYTLPDGSVGIRYDFFGALVNPNHAAFYLVSVLVCCCALFLHYYERTTLEVKKSGPHLLLFVLAGMIAGTVFFTLSRAGLFTAIGVGLVAGALFFWSMVRLGGLKGNPLPGVLLVVGALALGGGVLLSQNPNTLEREVQSAKQVFKEPQTDVRWQLYQAGWELHKYRELTGWGAGAFRYFYIAIIQRYPEVEPTTWRLRLQADGSLKYEEVPNFFTHLHNDWLEALIEYGWVGCAPMLLALFWTLWKLFQRRVLVNALTLMLLAGAGALAVLGFAEFPLRLPGLAALFVTLWVLSVRYVEAEHERMLALAAGKQVKEEQETINTV